MAAADCEMCAMLGYRICDRCSAGIVFDGYRDAFGRDLCANCR